MSAPPYSASESRSPTGLPPDDVLPARSTPDVADSSYTPGSRHSRLRLGLTRNSHSDLAPGRYANSHGQDCRPLLRFGPRVHPLKPLARPCKRTRAGPAQLQLGACPCRRVRVRASRLLLRPPRRGCMSKARNGNRREGHGCAYGVPGRLAVCFRAVAREKERKRNGGGETTPIRSRCGRTTSIRSAAAGSSCWAGRAEGHH